MYAGGAVALMPSIGFGSSFGIVCSSVGKRSKFYIKFFTVLDKALTGKLLSCMMKDLVFELGAKR